ncbi:TPA: hypothetical protein N0F65_003847 [Lagenidium giganteum]|uniref:Uncharacterized protein n=1 Tax=Lagenidium giganteum TaxID=4803 RepID=A0AAV2YSJ4_9STRA|nr:TPA: hypothetical protein N0F65_003847 [Lagenidium giganteum]
MRSDSDSSSDDDIPLSKLKEEVRAEKKQAATASIKAEPSSSATSAPASKPAKPAESDSDDDVPISGLVKNKRKVETTAAVKREPARASPRTPTKKAKKRIKIMYKQQELTEELYQTLKGRLTQELLCRWWYAMEWPPQDDRERPHGTQALDGFAGTYIRVKGDDMGSIIDTRTSHGKPSFLHFFAMDSAEIQALLVKAYKNQMKVLIEHEGEDTPLLKELKSACSAAEKISPEKADKSVSKVLKKYQEFEKQIAAIHDKRVKDDEEEDDDDDE